MEERIAEFGVVLDDVLDRVAMSPPFVSGRVSAVDIALEPRRDKILDALARGVPPGTLARKFVEANAPFAAESIRLGILRLRDAHKKPSRSSSLRRRDETHSKSSPPDKSAIENRRDAVPAPVNRASTEKPAGHPVAIRDF